MRKLAPIIALAAAVTFVSAPSMAQQRASSDSGVVLATLGGVVIGGALVYYYYPLSQLTTMTLGAVVGGSVGNWWYSVAEGTADGYQAPLPRKSDVDGSAKPFRLVTYTEGSRPAIRPAN
jgi:hypothetical protein